MIVFEALRHCLAVRIEAETAQEAIDKARAEPRGIVRMSCPSPVLNFQVGGMIACFMAKYPKVDVHLESTNRRVDVLREGLDLAIRVRFPPLEETDLVVKQLATSPQQLVASPLLLQERALPLVPEDLVTLPGMAWSPSQQDHEWLLHGPNGATARIPYQPHFVTEDMVALRLAALRGVGVVRLPTIVVSQRLLTIFGRGDLIVCWGKHIVNDLATIRLVLDHQNALAHAASTCRSTTTGSLNANVEPWPGCDSTQILPPCISMMRFDMASPKPVPPFFLVMALSACWNS